MKIVEIWGLIAPIMTFVIGYSMGVEVGNIDGRADAYKEIKQNVR